MKHIVRWTRTTFVAKVSEISDTDWKEKAKSVFEYLATEYGSLKSIALIFHDRDYNFRRRKDALSHDS